MPGEQGVVDESGAVGELGGEDHADRDRLAVPQPVSLGLLDRVTEGVSVVQDLAETGLLEVHADDVGLDPDGPLDELDEVRSVGARGAGRVGLDEVEDRGIGDEPRLDDLREAGDEVRRRQRGQDVEVAHDADRRVEGSDEVLALGGVDAGLAPDGRVDHGEQGRRDGDPGAAAQPGRGDEPGQVGDGPAPDPHDRVGPGEPGHAELAPEPRGDVGRLGRLCVGDARPVDLQAQATQCARHGVGVGQVPAADDEDPPRGRRDELGDAVEQVAPDDDVVVRVAVDGDPANPVDRGAAHVSPLPGGGRSPS